MSDAEAARARATILRLLSERDAGKTICPSDAARTIAGEADFRPLMDPIRAAAGRLVEEGRIEVTQGGEPVDLERAKGPIRLRAIEGAEARER